MPSKKVINMPETANKKWATSVSSVSSASSNSRANFSSCPSSVSSLSGRSIWSLQQHRQFKHQQQVLISKPLLSSKFHRAAIDGYVDMLCEASKRDANLAAKEHHHLTPTLLAAQCGQLEALRILVGRGGDPECVSANGSSALHLAAARNHLNCVSFLVNFGVNMWALDNELRTAKDLAAIEQCKDVLDYLDQMMAKRSAINTRQVQKLKEKAKLGAEKRLKQVRKAQLKAIKQVERDERQLAKMSHQRRLLRAAHSISDIKLVGRSSLDLDTVGQSAPVHTIASHINQRLQADLLARRNVQRSATCAAAADQVGANNKPTPDNKNGITCKQENQATISSLSSASGYMSNSSTASRSNRIVSSSMTIGTNRSNSPPVIAESTRPKFSDLVGLSGPSRTTSTTTASNNGTGEYDQVLQAADASSASSSTFALRLRAIGAVSRRVQLKKLLGVANSCASPKSAQAKNIRPASSGILKRAISEPNLGPNEDAAVMLSDDEQSQEKEEEANNFNDDKIDYQNGIAKREETISNGCNDQRQAKEEEKVAKQKHCPISTPPQQPPIAPPMPSAKQLASVGEEIGSQQQIKQHHSFFTQCLSQLKMQAINQRQSVHSKQPLQSNDTDELLRHQMSAGEFPLKPSAIKQQQKCLTATNAFEQHCDKASNKTQSADSIGSVGSILQLASYINPGSSCDSSSPTCDLSSDAPSSSSLSSQSKHKHSMQKFLASHGLCELSTILEQEKIDFEALMLLSEDDLKSLNILLGPRKKLLNAIVKFKQQGYSPLLVVDTQL